MKERQYPVEEWIKLYEARKSIREIAKIYGVDDKTIYSRFKKAKIKFRTNKNRNDFILNQKFGNLLVVEKTNELATDGCQGWKCLCDCGEFVIVGFYKLRHGSQKCEKCWRLAQAKQYSKGIEEISGKYISRIKRGAKSRKLEYNLDNNYLYELFLKQNKKCALTGVEIYLEGKAGEDKKEQTASLDRIDSCKGYIRDNVQWIHKIVNTLKMDLNEEELKYWCKKIIDYDKN